MRYDKDWYENLKKPVYQPPSWVFSPVWMVLYLMMLGAFILVLSKGFSYLALVAFFLFFLQLGVNLSWPVAFFKEHNLKKSFYTCFVLVFIVLLTMLVFHMISELAGFLLIPYFLWCSFATIFNYDIYRLNSNK